jgi:DNA-directed RNA polymerase
MQQFSGIEYLCIDIANNFGKDKTTGFKGDKDTFTNRIQWVKDNFHKLEQRTDEVDEDKYLYIKGVQALRKVVKGEPTGHLIMLDATCSGMQILSALTGCIKGARITNMLKGDVRYDAYTVITEAMQNVLNNRGHNGFKVLRPDAKQAVMTLN